MSSAGAPGARQGWNAAVLSVLFLVVAALLFFGIYLAIPGNQHFGALLLIGTLSLIFALGCYLLESASRDPAAQRSLAWAFMAMGFATLFLSVGLGNYYGVESFGTMLVGIILLVILLAVTVVLVGWRLRSVAATEHREVARQTWRKETPVSAFSYTTANSPSVPTTAPPPATSTGTTPPRSP